jgi:hypothetical protein
MTRNPCRIAGEIIVACKPGCHRKRQVGTPFAIALALAWSACQGQWRHIDSESLARSTRLHLDFSRPIEGVVVDAKDEFQSGSGPYMDRTSDKMESGSVTS